MTIIDLLGRDLAKVYLKSFEAQGFDEERLELMKNTKMYKLFIGKTFYTDSATHKKIWYKRTRSSQSEFLIIQMTLAMYRDTILKQEEYESLKAMMNGQEDDKELARALVERFRPRYLNYIKKNKLPNKISLV